MVKLSPNGFLSFSRAKNILKRSITFRTQKATLQREQVRFSALSRSSLITGANRSGLMKGWLLEAEMYR